MAIKKATAVKKEGIMAQRITLFSEDKLVQNFFEEKMDTRNNFISWGNNNNFPSFLCELSRKSALHSAILRAKTDMISAAGFIDSGDEKQKLFIENKFSKNNLEEIAQMISYDLNIYGMCALNVRWSKGGKQLSIAQIEYLNVANLREFYTEDIDAYNKHNKTNLKKDLTYYWYKNSWTNKYSNEDAQLFQEYSEEFNSKQEEKSQILIIKEYVPGIVVYSVPDYFSGILSIMTDEQISTFWYSTLIRSFAPSYWVHSNNGEPRTEEEVDRIYKNLTKKFKGSEHAGEIILTFSNGKERKVEIKALETSNLDAKFLSLQSYITENLLSSHRVTNGEIFGIATAGQLGQAKDALINSYELFYTTVIKPKIKLIENNLNKFAKVNQFSEFKLDKFQIYEDNSTAPSSVEENKIGYKKIT